MHAQDSEKNITWVQWQKLDADASVTNLVVDALVA